MTLGRQLFMGLSIIFALMALGQSVAKRSTRLLVALGVIGTSFFCH